MLPVALVLVGAIPADATNQMWQHWQTIPGVFDVAGPRSDGELVVAGSGNLYLVDPSGAVIAYARGSHGYADDAGAEAYLTVANGQATGVAGCSFAADDVFALRLHAPLGITRIDAQGEATPFATVPGVGSLNGIAFDTTGRFGFRLLVSGSANGKTAIAAIDCNGAVEFITHDAPAMEGGLAVAPTGFGSFGGDLIAPDELSGKIYAVGPDGAVSVVATSGLPTGGDIGVESVAFVPSGLIVGGEVYYSDRGTANNPHPGTDSLLRLSATYLAAAGVRDGDLLAATEGGATMIAVSCQATCQVITVVGSPSTSHGEGHIAFTVVKAIPPAASPTPSIAAGTRPGPAPPNRLSALTAAFLIGLVIAALAVWLARRRRVARRP